MKKIVYGEYCATMYAVYIDGSQVYTAGNSPYDSQGYVSAKAGVGLKKMREFCKITCEEMASEHDAVFTGVKRVDQSALVRSE